MKTFKILVKSAVPKIFIPVFLLTFILQGYMLGGINPKLLTLTNGISPMDLKMGFSVDYVVQFLQLLGEQGRHIYLNQFLFTDWFFSLIAGVAWALFLTWLYRKTFSSKPNLQKFGIIPLFITLFDYVENICFVILTKSYPVVSPALSKVASISGVIKNMVFILTILQILFLLVVLLWKAISKKKPAKVK